MTDFVILPATEPTRLTVRTRITRSAFVALSWCLCRGQPVFGLQGDSLLKAQLRNGMYDAASGQAIARILADAEAQRFPTALLEWRIRDYAARDAAGPTVVRMAREYFAMLTQVRSTLGTSADTMAVEAGLEAVELGLPMSTLAKMRAARPTESLAGALKVTVNLVRRAVPVDSVSIDFVEFLAGGVSYRQLIELEAAVFFAAFRHRPTLPVYETEVAKIRAGERQRVRPREPTAIRFLRTPLLSRGVGRHRSGHLYRCPGAAATRVVGIRIPDLASAPTA